MSRQRSQRIMQTAIEACLAATILSGCITVTEPLSDPYASRVDKRLLGAWQKDDGSHRCEIDSPSVKGNPRGLMRLVSEGGEENACWFFTTNIGGDSYATLCLEAEDTELKFPDFRKEGAFQEWSKKTNRRCIIVRFTLDEDKLVVQVGREAALKEMMSSEKVSSIEGFFKAPPGWLANYLEQNGPQTLYDGTDILHLQRPNSMDQP